MKVKDDLHALMQRYLKKHKETYDDLMEEIIVSRLEATSAADLIQ